MSFFKESSFFGTNLWKSKCPFFKDLSFFGSTSLLNPVDVRIQQSFIFPLFWDFRKFTSNCYQNGLKHNANPKKWCIWRLEMQLIFKKFTKRLKKATKRAFYPSNRLIGRFRPYFSEKRTKMHFFGQKVAKFWKKLHF